MTDDDPTPTRPAWATPAIIDLLEMALARQFTGGDALVEVTPPGSPVPVFLVDAGKVVDAAIAALVDEDLVIIPDQHVDVVRYEDLAGQHRWRALDDSNGQTIADSGEGYVSTTHCAHMAERLFPTANTTTKENPTT